MKSVNIVRCSLVKERRVQYENENISCADDVIELFRKLGYGEFAEEVFGMVCVDVKGNITGYHEVSHGDLSNSIVHPREVFKRALLNNACAIILCHNHPSGSTTPSKEDIKLTRRLEEAGKILGIQLCDHIIIGGEESLSFKKEGLI